MQRLIVLDQDLKKLGDPKARLRVVNSGDALIVSSSKSAKNSERLKIEVARYQTDFQNRNQGLIDQSKLQAERVTLLGAGSGGSKVARSLVRSGVVKLTIVDFDKVDVANLCRSEYDLNDIGQKKIRALGQALRRINPTVELNLIDRDILKMEHTALEALVNNSSLIIEGTDNVKTKVLINGLAYDKVPVLYPAVYDQGKSGKILFAVPGVTPCYECVMSSILPQMGEVKRGDWDYSTGGTKPLAGLNADIDIVAARCVKLALAFLLEGTEKAFLEKVTERDCSILFISNQKDFFIFDEPFQEVWGKTEIDPECTCQTLRAHEAETHSQKPADSANTGPGPAHNDANDALILPEQEPSETSEADS